MKKKQLFLITILSSFLLSGCIDIPTASSENPQTVIKSQSQGQSLPITGKLILNDIQIDLEIAVTPEQQAIGLMFRDTLPSNRGMLFPFNPPTRVNFWMKNVSFPLDLIFLADGIVKDIAHNVPPCEKEPCPIYSPNSEIDQVLELGGGSAQNFGITKGDRLNIIILEEKEKNSAKIE